MYRSNKRLIYIALTIIFIFCGISSGFFIHKYMKAEVLAKPSKLSDIKIGENKEEKNKDLKTVIYENQKFVVCLEVENNRGKVLGSGFLYNDKGDIITNAHVVDGNSEVTVKMADTTTYKGTVIGKSDTIDVAVIRVSELEGKTPIKVKKNKKADIGDEVIALGSPLGLQNTATTGIISGLNRDFNIKNYKYKGVYQISAPISPGNSGGPLLDKKTGEVIGINSARLGEENIGFSMPVKQVLSLVDSWVANPSIRKYENSEKEIKTNLSKEAAEYLVAYFYYCINSQDYVSAYSLLGSDWQKQIPYDTFRKGFLNTVSVKIENMASKDDNFFQVIAIIEAAEKENGTNKLRKYKTTYKVGVENNKLKLLHGEVKKFRSSSIFK